MRIRAAFGVALAAGLTACSGQVDTSHDIEYEAQDACHHYVEARLKSPGTADFSDEKIAGVGNHWTCTGNVDSQNSFGGVVRNAYSIEVEKRGDGRWYVVALTGLGN